MGLSLPFHLPAPIAGAADAFGNFLNPGNATALPSLPGEVHSFQHLPPGQQAIAGATAGAGLGGALGVGGALAGGAAGDVGAAEAGAAGAGGTALGSVAKGAGIGAAAGLATGAVSQFSSIASALGNPDFWKGAGLVLIAVVMGILAIREFA